MAEPFMQYVVHDAIALAGHADRLPELYGRWSQFLTGGYDTIGEDWRHGTHVHGWSCTPTKDMIFYTLGVTPAEPGYAAARIAPRLGSLAWAEGKVPTPHGLISVRAEPGMVSVDSPVPMVVDLPAPATTPASRGEARSPGVDGWLPSTGSHRNPRNAPSKDSRPRFGDGMRWRRKAMSEPRRYKLIACEVMFHELSTVQRKAGTSST